MAFPRNKAQWSADSVKQAGNRKIWLADRATVKVDVKKLHDDVKARNKSAIGGDKTQLATDRSKETPTGRRSQRRRTS